MWGSRRDAVIALGFAVACMVEVVVRDATRPLWLLSGLAAVGGMALLVLRRTRPLLALTGYVMGAAASTGLQTLLPDPTPRTTGAFVPIIALVVLCYSIGVYGDRHALLLGIPQPLGLVALVDVIQPVSGSLLPGLAFFGLFVVAAPMLAGRMVRRRRALLAEIHRLEEAAGAEHLLRLRAVRAEESLAVSDELQKTLVSGLRDLQRCGSPDLVEARARELLAATRSTVVRLTGRSVQGPETARAPAGTSVDLVDPAEATAGIVALAAAAVGTTLLVETHAQWGPRVLALPLAAVVVGGLVLASRRPLLGVSLAWAAAVTFHLTVASLADTLAAVALVVVTTFLGCWLLPARPAVLAAVASVGVAIGLRVGDVPGLLAFGILATIAGRVLREHNRLLARLGAAHLEASIRRSTELDTRVLEERARMARELHDSVGHGLTVVALQAAAARRLTTTDPRTSQAALATLRGALDQTLAELRTGFTTGPALPELLSAARSLGVVVHVVGSPPTGPDGRLLDRVIREALTNALRHAPGAEIRLTFEDREGSVRCTVANDAPRAGPGPRGTGTGLPGIAARVRGAGGTARWQATPAGGFELDVRLPRTQEVPL
jgi:signal transduction histidine kinase